MKRLYRSRRERIIAGVCGGMAEYFDVDPTIIRVIWVLGAMVTMFFPGVLLYFVCWAIIPPAPATV
ncbi:MAG TPA: PspC domain-containing protein [Chloroflexota bacterium]|nr:PspC domain-containing protein [Chloroflexota bacterium]